MPGVRVLVVAAAGDLRASLRFGLEAEGYDVTCAEYPLDGDAGGDFACTVLDHHAIARGAALQRFCAEHAPVIYLTNVLDATAGSGAAREVVMPQLGQALFDAVRQAVAGEARQGR